jgi:hypothetical protein
MPWPSSRAKKRAVYSKGEINRLIDSLLHPLFDLNPAFNIADTVLHDFVEQNPPETPPEVPPIQPSTNHQRID